MTHPLDNVIWSALTTVQSPLSTPLSIGDERARRFDPRYAGFAALPDESPANFAALAGLLRAGEGASIVAVGDVKPGPLFEVVARKNLVQMVGATSGEAADTARFVVLGADDVPEMTALVRLTEPGPWFERSSELGRFLGFKADGRLVAMAGERLRVPGHTEISGVCCHPDFRGRGLAADLMRCVSQGIVARGETPFLHVIAENTGAIALYEKLGLRVRHRRRLTLLKRSDPAA